MAIIPFAPAPALLYLLAMSDLSTRIRQFCISNGLKLNTDLGQHFLIDQAVLDAIIDAAQIQSDEHIVEIGSGIGVLTAALLQKTSRVTTIEFDARMIPLMQRYINQELANQPGAPKVKPDQGIPGLTIINENALHVPFPSDPYKIVANIPYHITSPLLRHAFLESPRPPQSLTLLIQREVAEKIADRKDASLLTIIVGLFGTARLVRTVPPGSFLPPPKVDSAVLHIDSYPQPKADAATIEKVMKLAKAGFTQKRKMLRNTIAALPGGEEALKKAGIDLTRRPQTLSIEEWIELARMM